MKRYDIINALIKNNGYKSYLEIGVQNPDNCFNKIECKVKMGVDPVITNENLLKIPKSEWIILYEMTSDHCFQTLDAKENKHKFDIIFIDGLHEAEQVKKDIANSLRWLNKKGMIVLHDCLPTSEMMQRVPREAKEWTGDVWKALVSFRANDELAIHVVDTDYGVGIICKCGNQKPIFIENPTYAEFEANKNEWLDIITPEEFTEAYIV